MEKAGTRFSQTAFYAVAVFLPFVFGHFLPKTDVLWGYLNFVNVVWGSVFGIGWAAMTEMRTESDTAGIVGFILWPALVVYMLVLLAGFILKQRKSTQITFMLVVVLSLLVNIEPNSVYREPFEKYPIFWKYFEGAS